ncbi:hypothetical protein [uncultured Nocardioides sp.]|uniref:hypothetical protein n=1 Tax=uncultured Nocardioides sp. TaxID=198441 RepID=UPI00262A7753|nr:hypothetical protein [uncultured Nocardioides sp.]
MTTNEYDGTPAPDGTPAAANPNAPRATTQPAPPPEVIDSGAPVPDGPRDAADPPPALPARLPPIQQPEVIDTGQWEVRHDRERVQDRLAMWLVVGVVIVSITCALGAAFGDLSGEAAILVPLLSGLFVALRLVIVKIFGPNR